MAHKKKIYEDYDNSRKAYRWRKKNNCMTKADLEREEKHAEIRHGSKMEALINSGEVKVKVKRGGNMVNVRKH